MRAKSNNQDNTGEDTNLSLSFYRCISVTFRIFFETCKIPHARGLTSERIEIVGDSLLRNFWFESHVFFMLSCRGLVSLYLCCTACIWMGMCSTLHLMNVRIKMNFRRIFSEIVTHRSLIILSSWIRQLVLFDEFLTRNCCRTINNNKNWLFKIKI